MTKLEIKARVLKLPIFSSAEQTTRFAAEQLQLAIQTEEVLNVSGQIDPAAKRLAEDCRLFLERACTAEDIFFDQNTQEGVMA